MNPGDGALEEEVGRFHIQDGPRGRGKQLRPPRRRLVCHGNQSAVLRGGRSARLPNDQETQHTFVETFQDWQFSDEAPVQWPQRMMLPVPVWLLSCVSAELATQLRSVWSKHSSQLTHEHVVPTFPSHVTGTFPRFASAPLPLSQRGSAVLQPPRALSPASWRGPLPSFVGESSNAHQSHG